MPGTLTVNPAALTITATSANMTYGSANPALSATCSGFVNGDTTNQLTAQVRLGTLATAASPVGSYPITASGAASANYTISYVPGTLTVSPAALIITANNTNRPYGAANPLLRASYSGFVNSYSGFVNGDATNQLTAQVSLSTLATASSPVGSYPIAVGGAASANYTISYVPGTLTVNPAALTITATVAAARMTQTGMELTFTGQPGFEYEVQATEDLAGGVWENLTRASGVRFTVVDPAALAKPVRFYRAILR